MAHGLAARSGGSLGLVLIVFDVLKLRGLRLPHAAVLSGATCLALIAATSSADGGIVFLGLIGLGAFALAAR